jgi:hypothetical protein
MVLSARASAPQGYGWQRVLIVSALPRCAATCKWVLGMRAQQAEVLEERF